MSGQLLVGCATEVEGMLFLLGILRTPLSTPRYPSPRVNRIHPIYITGSPAKMPVADSAAESYVATVLRMEYTVCHRVHLLPFPHLCSISIHCQL